MSTYFFKIFLTTIFLIFVIDIHATNNEMDSMLSIYRSVSISDTMKCYALARLSDIEYDDTKWPEYNNELYEISKSQMDLKKHPKHIQDVFKKFYCISVSNKAYILNEYGSPTKALEIIQEAVNINKSLKDINVEILINSTIQSTYEYRSDHKNALKYCLITYEICKKVDDFDKMATCITNMGVLYDKLGQSQKAIEIYKQVIDLAEKKKNLSAQANALQILGIYYYDIGQINQGIQTLLKSLGLFEKLGDKSNTAYGYGQIGNIIAQYGDEEKGISYLKKSVQSYKQLNNIEYEHRFLKLLWNLRLRKIKSSNFPLEQKRTELLNLINELNAISPRINQSENIILRASTDITKGDFYYQKSIFFDQNKSLTLDSALDLYIKSLAEIEQTGDISFSASTQSKIAQIYFDKGNFNQAEFHAEKGLSSAIKDSFMNDIVSNATILSKLYAKNNQSDKLASMLDLILKTKEKIYDSDVKANILKSNFKFESEKSELEINNLAQENKIKSLQNGMILGGSLVLGLIGLFFFYRFRTKKKIELNNEQFKSLTSELRLLKSQMNPHFMFNAIGSVSAMMKDGKQEAAQESLTKFATLMRSTLEQSRGEYIAIEDEVGFLDSYLHLEKNLLGDSFNYSISVDEMIDQSYDRIPSLILQPIVENSLKHGLRTKLGDKKLDIKFELNESDNILMISIADNGIGRAAAAELNKDRKNHQSFASKSIEDRIKIINTTKGFESIQMKIVDLQEINEARGTKVEILINLD